MDKTCSCGRFEFSSKWVTHVGYPSNGHGNADNFCPSCGDQLLPDGRVIQRETIPNRLMDMLKEVQADCPEAGLQEFALKVFNWIEEMREQAGLTERELNDKVFPDLDSTVYLYPGVFTEHPAYLNIGLLLRYLNAAQKAQEAK